MTAKPRIKTCPECVHDGGIHYSDDGETWTRPHLDALLGQKQAIALTEAAHAEQTKRAREIIYHAACTLSEWSANNVRAEMLDAGIDGPVVSAAFNYAVGQGWIEATGAYVMSTDPGTRHKINVWRSIAPSAVAS